ncbi:MAG: hypothetical protein EOM10_17315, partial [Opitutae bacterium]|nr:hypothetical protein [Opitutae bacterium]
GLPPVGGLWGLAFRLLGFSDTIAYFQAETEANWLRVHQPEIWARTRHFLLLSGYLNWRLTGRFVDSAGSIVAYLPFDYKRLAWAPARDWKWQATGVAPDLLPELVPPTAVMGQVTGAAAAETGMPAGLPVVAAAADKACEVIGAGSLEPHVGCLSYGTTAPINVTSARYVEPVRLLPPYPSAAPGRYSLEAMIYRGYWMVSWFKQQFGHLEARAAEMENVSAAAPEGGGAARGPMPNRRRGSRQAGGLMQSIVPSDLSRRHPSPRLGGPYALLRRRVQGSVSQDGGRVFPFPHMSRARGTAAAWETTARRSRG